MLEDCINTLLCGTYQRIEVIVVDNASTDGTPEMLRKSFPSVRILHNKVNAFAVQARNQGLREAQGEYLLLLDDDNKLDLCMVEHLVRMAHSDSSIGFVGPKMYYYGSNKLLYWTGAMIHPITSRTVYRGKNEKDQGQYDEPVQTEHIPNVFLMTREAYQATGGFDEIYDMSYGESDLPMRARRLGFKVMYCPKAIAWHKVPLPGKGAPVFKLPFRGYYFSRNRVIYMKRFSTRFQFLLFFFIFYPFFTIIYSLWIMSNGEWKSLRYHLLGSWHGILHALSRKNAVRSPRWNNATVQMP